MSLRYLLLAAVAVLPALWVACDETPNGCEDAKQSIQAQIKTDICTDPAYANTPFCACCVAHELYSVSADCTCRALLFDADSCYYAVGDQATPQARDAVEYANSICAGRVVGVPGLDASVGACGPVGGTTSSSSSSSSASSSGAPGTGGAGTTSSSGTMGTGGGH